VSEKSEHAPGRPAPPAKNGPSSHVVPPEARLLGAFLVCFFVASRALALDVQVKDVRAAASAVRATIEVRDFVPDRFRKTLEAGGALHLRLQAELWEGRPVWDRLVYPAITRVFRLARASSASEVSILDSDGQSTTYRAVPNALPVVIDLGDRERVSATQKYYVHVVATLGTLADREVDAAGDAVFGRESETNTLGSFGRLVFRTVLQVSDYMQSVTAEAKSRKMGGSDLLKQRSP